MMQQRTRQAGFTLMELLVAITVTVLMLFLINRIFFDTTRAVSQGIGLSDIIANQRALADQIDRDAIDMIGPSVVTSGTTTPPHGILIILNKQITRGGPGVPMPDPNRRGETIAEPLRSDQLMFFVDLGTNASDRDTPLVPNDTTSFGNSNPSPQYARIWYGHGRRTQPRGTDSAGLDDPDATDNRLGYNWILSRHALFLDVNVPGSDIQAQNARADATVTGYGPLPPGIVDRMYMGLADVADRDLASTANPTGAIIGVDSTTDTGYALHTGQSQANYISGALELTYGVERLRVNPQPLYDPNNTRYRFNSWQIAQMHAFLMENVSDFIVEFAADADGDGEIDLDVDGDGWPDLGATEGDIVWYGEIDNNGDPILPDLSPFDFKSGGLLASRDPVETNAANLPPNADVAFVWRHDYPDNWPYLIRIRYRLHDSRGRVKGSQFNTSTNEYQPTAGIWFELILLVNRNN